MNSQVREIALRLAASIGQPVEEEWFCEDDCWAIVTRLEAMMLADQRIPPAALRFLEDLALALNIRSGDGATFHSALEAQLGTSPLSAETLRAIVRYVRSQLHFAARLSRVELRPSVVHVPLKNYEFK